MRRPTLQPSWTRVRRQRTVLGETCVDLRGSHGEGERNRNIRSIRELGRREWHASSGYSKRSMVENTVFRYKTIIGRSMRSRSFDGQRVEVRLASKILNAMTLLAMPDSYRVA